MAKPTLKFLAEQLGISQSAVTLVMKNRPGVSDTTRKKVLETAAEMGIYPQADKNTKKICFLIYGLVSDYFSGLPFYSSLSQYFHNAATEKNASLYIQYTNIDELSPNNDFDGYVALISHSARNDYMRLKSLNKPVVVIGSEDTFDAFDTVAMDNEGGIRKGVEHLISLGHKRIGYIRTGDIVTDYDMRYESFLKAMRLNNLSVGDSDIINLNRSSLHGKWDFDFIINNISEYPSAFMTDDDVTAIRFLNELKENNICVGKDISLMGFDNSSFAQLSSPKLSSIDTNSEEIATVAIERLLEIIDKPSEIKRKYIISTSLVVRESTQMD